MPSALLDLRSAAGGILYFESILSSGGAKKQPVRCRHFYENGDYIK